jgi:hypothetical protein
MERLFEIQRIIIEQLENQPSFWRDQFADDIIVGSKHAIPLYLFGFLY